MGLLKTGGSFTLGVVVGAGIALVAPHAVKPLARAARPLAKEIIKGSLIALETGQAFVKEAKQSIEDEAKAEETGNKA